MVQSINHKRVDILRHDTRIVVRELGLLKEAYFDIGVTLAMRHLLIEMKKCQGPTVNELAQRLLLDKSSTSRLVTKASKRGFVECQVDHEDKRRKCLKMTKEGEKTLEAFETIAQGQVVDALASLSPEEREVVHRGMSLFAKGLEKARANREQRGKEG